MRILKNYWNRQGLWEKFFLIIIPASLLSSVLILSLAYMVFGVYEKKMYQLARQNLSLVVGKIETELMEAGVIGTDLIINDDIQKAVAGEQTDKRGEARTMDDIRTDQQVYKVLQRAMSRDGHMSSISIFTDDTWYYVGNTNRSYDRSLLGKVRFDSDMAPSQMMWCAAEYPDSHLYGIQPVIDIYFGSFQKAAVLVLEYDLEGCLNSIRQHSENTSFMQEFAIYNGEETIYSDISPDSGLEWEKDQDYKIVSVDGRTYFASYLNESVYGWKYVFLVNYDDLLGAMRFLKYLFCAVAVVVTGISVLYCRRLTRSITDRFAWLLDRMRLVRQGSFQVETAKPDGHNSASRDEIDLLCQKFEDMVGALDELIQENYVKQMLIQENRLKELQSQINPHFLFNTLQTVNWKAKANSQREISEIVESLGKLLRYTLEGDEDPVSLKSELEILKRYVLIQQVRYGERLTVQMDVPQALGEKCLPKLSLQNIVENSIKYALENMLEPCVIRVWAELTGDGYRICVEDNGPGIRDEALKGIGREGEGEHSIAGLGIGLDNIRDRVRLLFPEGSCLQIGNTGRGTLTQIVIREQSGERIGKA